MNSASRSSYPLLKEHWAFSDGAQGILFDRQSMRVFLLQPELATILDQVLRGADTFDAESNHEAAVLDVLNEFHKNDASNPLAGFSSQERPSVLRQTKNRAGAGRYLNKLAINVANDCNLACTYCYANGGLYGTPERSLLSTQDVDRYIRRFCERFDYIEGVQFMGGEPSMNHSAVHQAGVVFRQLAEEGLLLGEPRYTLVTNGLAFTENFLAVCKEMNIELTVSLDGPALVHDVARVRRNGTGSYSAVRKNIDRAVAAGVSVEFEPTFSRAHLDNGMNLIELVEWFNKEFGVTTLHAPPMSENRFEKDSLGLSAEDKLREYCAVTEWGIDNLLQRKRYLMHTFTARILTSLELKKRNSHICPAGNTLLSLSTSGDVSPCWMYTDEAVFNMGNINDEKFLDVKAKKVTDLIGKYELQEHPDCKTCIVQSTCFGCKGGDYHATGSPSGKNNCDYMRAMIVTAMMRVYSRPDLPSLSSDYYKRASFGETIYDRLRPISTLKPVIIERPVNFVKR